MECFLAHPGGYLSSKERTWKAAKEQAWDTGLASGASLARSTELTAQNMPVALAHMTTISAVVLAHMTTIFGLDFFLG